MSSQFFPVLCQRVQHAANNQSRWHGCKGAKNERDTADQYLIGNQNFGGDFIQSINRRVEDLVPEMAVNPGAQIIAKV